MKLFEFEIQSDSCAVQLEVVAETPEQASRFARSLEDTTSSISSPRFVADASDDANQYEYRYY